MMRKWQAILTSAAVAAGAACSDALTSPSAEADALFDLSGAFNTIPQGYGDVPNSYVGSAAAAQPWLIDAHRRGPGGDSLMGGGLAEAFVGGVGFGRGFGHHGPFGGGAACTGGTFSAATGRVTCPAATLRNGLTAARSAAYADASGRVQQAFDSLTTNTVNLRTEVSGTITLDSAGRAGAFGFGRRGGGHGGRKRGGHGPGAQGALLLGDTATILSATSTVRNTSDRTVAGLAQGSTQRTVDATSASQESTTGRSSRGDFTATRTAADTTRGVIVPVATAGTTAYPTAGTVIRVMQASVAYTGQTPATSSRREVVAYDGSATARVVITEDGVTRTCTRPLPRGRLTCQ